MKPRLLLLCPTKTYRAEAFVRAAQRLPVELSIASEEPSALSHLHPESLPAFDFSDLDAVRAFAAEFSAHTPIHAVVAVDDQATLAAAAVCETLRLAGNTVDAVYAATNKYAMRRRMRDAGVPVPWFRLVSVDDDAGSVAADLPYPVVVKPLMMAASRGVIRADDPAAFADAFARTRAIVTGRDAPPDPQARSHVLVESYLPGWEVALEGLVTAGKLEVLAIFDKPDPLEGPVFPETIYVTPARLDGRSRARVIEATQRTVTALGIAHGPVHAELRGTPDAVHLVEIAARSIGGLCSRVLRFAGNTSLEDLILQHALGMVARVPPLDRAAAGVMMMQSPVAGRFVEARGTDEARDVDGVEEVIISAHPGRRLAPLPEGFLYLGFIFARGSDPGAVEKALREAFAKIDVVIESD